MCVDYEFWRPNVASVEELHRFRDELLASCANYSQAARRLATFYSKNLSGTAKVRVDAQIGLAERAGFSGVLQLECIPWHSARLPKKSAVLRVIQKDRELREYVHALRAFLSDRVTVAVSAVSARADLTAPRLCLADWLRWQAEVLGVDCERAERVRLVEKEGRVTSVALLHGYHVLILMMGGNHFPSKSNSGTLVEALRQIALARI